MKILLIEDCYIYIDNFLLTLQGVAEVILPPTFTSPWVVGSRRNLGSFPPLEEMKDFIAQSDAEIVLLDINLGTTYKGWDLFDACKGKKVLITSLDGCHPSSGKSWSKKGSLFPSEPEVRDEFIQLIQTL